MRKQRQEPMNTLEQFCPNAACLARGKIGAGNIRIQDRTRQRYRCRQCRCTFSARRRPMLEGLCTPTELIVIVVTLLAYRCPVQAIVHAYDLDERTVAKWRDRTGAHYQQVHHALVEPGKLDLLHVQADEIRVKGRSLIAWMGLSMMVLTRLWLGGVVSRTCGTALADRIMAQVRACSHAACALLVFTDGWAAYPQEYLPSVSGESQRNGRTRTLLLTNMIRPVHLHGHQTHQEETGRGSHPKDDTRNRSASKALVEGVTRRKRAQCRVY